MELSEVRASQALPKDLRGVVDRFGECLFPCRDDIVPPKPIAGVLAASPPEFAGRQG